MKKKTGEKIQTIMSIMLNTSWLILIGVFITTTILAIALGEDYISLFSILGIWMCLHEYKHNERKWR